MTPRLKSFAAFVLLALTLASVPLTPGCAQVDPAGVYQGDAFLFNTEQSLVSAKESLDVVVRWEHNNRKLLSGTPAITKGVDAIRARAPESFASANNLVSAYKRAPTAENRQALETALSVVNELVKEALGYYIKFGLKG